MVGPVKISYVNNSGYAIPPYGVVEFSGNMQTLANGELTIPIVRPTGNGPYAIDDGKGANSTSTGKYGTAIIPYDNVAWVAWDGTDPGVAWQGTVGPIANSVFMGNKGSGYLYAGQKDTVNSRILVVQKPPAPGVTTIRFLVISSDPNTLTVLGEVKAWDAGYTLYDVPGDLNAAFGLGPPLGVVEVCDPSGCYFDEPYDMLFGRMGWAKYTSSLTADSCRTGYPPFPPKWEVFSLCCAKPLCSFGGA